MVFPYPLFYLIPNRPAIKNFPHQRHALLDLECQLLLSAIELLRYEANNRIVLAIIISTRLFNPIPPFFPSRIAKSRSPTLITHNDHIIDLGPILFFTTPTSLPHQT